MSSFMPTIPALCGAGILSAIYALAQQPAEIPTQMVPVVPGFSNEGQLLLAVITILASAFTAWLNMRNNKIAAEREAARQLAAERERELDMAERRMAREKLDNRLNTIEEAAKSSVPSDVVKEIVKENK